MQSIPDLEFEFQSLAPLVSREYMFLLEHVAIMDFESPEEQFNK